MKKWNWYLDLSKRPAGKALPKLILNALGLSRVKGGCDEVKGQVITSRDSSADAGPDRPNPVLAALGHPPDARLLVTHLDDVGMNAGGNTAWEATHRAGALASASVMMPCPNAHEALDLANRLGTGGRLPDFGVHLTLTCEWESYLWGPLDSSLAGLLTDSRGALPREIGEHMRITGSPEGRAAVEQELQAQLEGAYRRFDDLSHIDTHMFILLYPPNLEIYMKLAMENRLPCMLPGTAAAWRDWSRSDEEAAALAAAVDPVRAAGMPLFDRVCGVPLENPPADRPAAVRQLIRDCVPGLNFLFLHANEATEQVREFAGDWKEREGDLKVFSDPELRRFIDSEGVILIGMRELRDLWRKNWPAGR